MINNYQNRFFFYLTQKVQVGESFEMSCEYESEEDVQVVCYKNRRVIK